MEPYVVYLDQVIANEKLFEYEVTLTYNNATQKINYSFRTFQVELYIKKY